MPSKKILAKKQKVVSKLATELKTAKSIVITDYMGLTVAEDTEMRSALRKEGVTYKVVKNTISLRAFNDIGITDMEDIFKGPTAVAFHKEDVVKAPRLIKEFAEKFKKTSIKGGVLDGSKSSADTMKALASIPTLPVLHGQLVSTLMYPIAKLAVTLNLAAAKLAAGEPSALTAEPTATE